ncbi:hypothetical protein HYH03_002481 [Edaphochlamys debaryana]|uniref:WW domain-containing protein n=1 Tax=Edaphochlamys debaryana TaxID=47281 RepID=A0A835YJ39_9CHLO|nr:hypothetical protein HYH03_002481 [Edaphochlamys debaryana]|eukprot:KAG2499535.1 hypothetical protein HYH03_002481 [Edaphochlamys debaryana]
MDGGSGSGSESDSDSGSGGAAGSLGRVEEVFAVTVTEASSGGASASSGTARQGAQRQEWLLRVVRRSDAYAEAYGFVGAEEYVLKLDSALLPHADVGAQVLYAAPPPELLEQGRRHLLLQLLRSELRPLLEGVEGTESGRAGGAEAGPSDKPADNLRRGHRRKAAGGEALPPAAAAPAPLPPGATLPSRKQLLEAGRRDLVELVAQAGGFAEVATHLGLRLARRPRGFWMGPGSWTRLGEELAVFVANSWLELPAPDEEGACYFFNQVSGRTTWRRPAPLKRLPAPAGGAPGAGGVRWVVAEPAANRVMPSQTAVLQAGRYDLHNAIVAHGGYTAVAQHLGRRVTWALSTRAYGSRATLRRQLAAAAEELGLPEGAMPTQRELQEAGRGALLAAVRRSGGFQAVAGSLRLRPRGRRRPRGHWDDPERLALELAAFAASRASLMAAGRMDLVYGMDRHRGRRRELAELAGLAPAASRRGTNRNALRLEDVRGALAAGCHTPKAIREHLEGRGVSVSRQHLTTWLASRVEEGLLARAGHGRYRDAHEEAGEEAAG